MGVARLLGDGSRIARIVHQICQLALQDATGGRMEVKLARAANGSQLTVGFHGRLEPAAEPPDTLELRTLVNEAGGHLSIVRDPPTGVQQYQVDFPLPALAPTVPPAPAAPEPAAPAEPAEDLSATQPPGDLGPQPLDGLTVLCVDDDEDALASLAALLQQDGARTEQANSGHAALALLASRDVDDWPDVLLCDIALGAEDGHAVVRSIRSMEARRDVPLNERLPAVALTGMAQPEDRLRALAAGFQRHLAKPVAPQELVRVLRQLARVHA
jgi:ATP-binding cassette subfamily B protein